MIAPSVADERAAALQDLGFAVAMPWRRQRVAVQVVLFILGCCAAILLSEALRRLDLPEGVITGVVCLAAAESLIQRKRFFWTGLELALWLFAMLSFVFALPSSGKPEAVLVVGAAIAVAAARMRNPLLGALAACSVVYYAHDKWHGVIEPVAVGIVVAIAAAAALLCAWRRRSTEQLFQAIVLVVPVFAWLVCIRTPNQYFQAAYALLASFLSALAIWKRDRILLIAAAIATTIACIDLAREFLDIPTEYRLIGGGLLALALALLLARALRARTRGFIATPEAAKSYDEAIQLLGVMHAGHPGPRGESTSGFDSGGGGFGGAGASGSY